MVNEELEKLYSDLIENNGISPEIIKQSLKVAFELGRSAGFEQAMENEYAS